MQLAPSLNILVCRKLYPGGAGQTFKCPADKFNIRAVREGNLNLATVNVQVSQILEFLTVSFPSAMDVPWMC